MFYNIKMVCVGGNGGKMYTLLYYMRAREDGVDGIDGVNGKRGDGNRGARLFTGLGKKFFRTGEEKFPDREEKRGKKIRKGQAKQVVHLIAYPFLIF